MTKIVDFCANLALTVCFGIEQLAVVLVSMVPIIELKGGIPIGVKYGLPLGEAFGWALLGSTLVFFPLYFILKWIFKMKFFSRIREVLGKKAAALTKKTDDMESKGASQKRVTFWKTFGVFAFAAIPIPLTGIWTSTFVAILVDLKFRFAALAIILGNAVAGGLILLLTWLLGAYLDWLLLGIFAIALLLGLYFLFKLLTAKTQATP